MAVPFFTRMIGYVSWTILSKKKINRKTPSRPKRRMSRVDQTQLRAHRQTPLMYIHPWHSCLRQLWESTGLFTSSCSHLRLLCWRKPIFGRMMHLNWNQLVASLDTESWNPAFSTCAKVTLKSTNSVNWIVQGAKNYYSGSIYSQQVKISRRTNTRYRGPKSSYTWRVAV